MTLTLRGCCREENKYRWGVVLLREKCYGQGGRPGKERDHRGPRSQPGCLKVSNIGKEVPEGPDRETTLPPLPLSVSLPTIVCIHSTLSVRSDSQTPQGTFESSGLHSVALALYWAKEGKLNFSNPTLVSPDQGSWISCVHHKWYNTLFSFIFRDFLKAGDKENIFNADHFPLWYRRAAEQIPGSFVYSIPFSTGGPGHLQFHSAGLVIVGICVSPGGSHVQPSASAEYIRPYLSPLAHLFYFGDKT